MKPRFIPQALAVTLLLLSLNAPMAFSAEITRQVSQASFDPQLAQLLIQSLTQAPITAQKVEHNPRKKQIVFFIPNTTLQPSPKIIQVTNDPLVRGIRMEQRALDGMPAVFVKVNLLSNATEIPFSIVPEAPGLKLIFSRPDRMSAIVQPKGVVLKGQRPENKTMVIQTTSSGLSFKSTDKDLSPANTVNSIIGPVSSNAYSVIQDIFYEDNSLAIISQKHPISVKRSFVLNEPNRYVLDISPAVLNSKALLRAIPQSNPRILSMRAGQFDESTVRVVVQFTKAASHVDISQWEDNKVLKLNF